jgi:hypothetical protein
VYDLGDPFPLSRRRVDARGVVAARVEHDDVASAGVFERVEHGVEIDHMRRAVVIGVHSDAQPGRFEDPRVVRPGRLAQPYGRVRAQPLEQVRRDAQRARAAGRVGRYRAPRVDEFVRRPEEQFAHPHAVFPRAFDGQIRFGGLFAQEALFGFLYGRQHGRLARRVLIDADGQVNFFGVWILFERLRKTHNGVRRSRLELIEQHSSPFL